MCVVALQCRNCRISSSTRRSWVWGAAEVARTHLLILYCNQMSCNVVKGHKMKTMLSRLVSLTRIGGVGPPKSAPRQWQEPRTCRYIDSDVASPIIAIFKSLKKDSTSSIYVILLLLLCLLSTFKLLWHWFLVNASLPQLLSCWLWPKTEVEIDSEFLNPEGQRIGYFLWTLKHKVCGCYLVRFFMFSNCYRSHLSNETLVILADLHSSIN